MRSFLFVAACSISLPALTQPLTQVVRGSVVDQVSRQALPGATVVVVGTNPLVGGTTDEEGNFKLNSVALGQQTVKVTFVGYKDRTLGIVVNSGKEVVLNIQIEEDIVKMEEVVITPDVEKNRPINDMSTVSARTFSVEETRKFAAAVNDPGRAALSFAGVVSTGDDSNTISIRGNAPNGLLWRMEGVDIPNPNHFADAGTSGGGISILSSQLMSNSDFLTGAFAAEYGNALAGVFDINLRKGNNEKREYTVQAGFLGLDAAAEGPFAKNYRGSYLINYRYSTLSILSNLGFNIGDEITNFQDLSYNIWLPTKRSGSFSLFGFGGLSSQLQEAVKDSTQWVNEGMRYQSTYFSNTGATGVKHSITFGDSYLQTSLVMSGNDHGYLEERLDDTYTPQFTYDQSFVNRKITLSSVLNNKLSARYNLRSGVYLNKYLYNLRLRDLDQQTQEVDEPLNSKSDVTTAQVFSQINYRPTKRLTLNAGMHVLFMTNNGEASFEPRASARYELNNNQQLSLGYGLHSQMQPVGVYEAQVEEDDGSITKPNQSVGLNKSHHVVLGYDRSLTRHLRLKTEAYYQHLFNIAVINDVNSPISTLVIEEGYLTAPLVNRGKGRNMGVEFTLEQFMQRNLYFLLSASLYDSKYTALDGIWHNTRFNGRHALSFTGGKDWEFKKSRTLGVNIRTIYTGGFRVTPIDVERSIAEGRPYAVPGQAFAEQLPDYFRTDLRISLKRNRPRSTSTIALDIQNVTNHENVGGRFFDPRRGAMVYWYQLPLLPVLSYRVEF
jgi:hypothetical protein